MDPRRNDIYNPYDPSDPRSRTHSRSYSSTTQGPYYGQVNQTPPAQIGAVNGSGYVHHRGSVVTDLTTPRNYPSPPMSSGPYGGYNVQGMAPPALSPPMTNYSYENDRQSHASKSKQPDRRSSSTSSESWSPSSAQTGYPSPVSPIQPNGSPPDRMEVITRSLSGVSMTGSPLPVRTNPASHVPVGSARHTPGRPSISRIRMAHEESVLDPNYMVRKDANTFFTVGRVFATLWHESYSSTGSTASNVTQEAVIGKFGQQIYSGIRRMVVVKQHDRHSWCCPISTYGRRGVGKTGVDPSKHVIIHSQGSEPQSGKNEPKMRKDPLEVTLARPDQKLDPMSRLNFGKIHTVEHNVKVMKVGQISERSMAKFLNYAKNEINL